MNRSFILGGLLAVLLVPATASAATVTLGSPLTRGVEPTGTGWCVGDGPGSACTVEQTALSGQDLAVPFDGVITRWAVRDAAGTLALRVLDGPLGLQRVVSSPAPVQATGGIQSFPMQLPVRAGQRIGVEVGDQSSLPFSYRDPQTKGAGWVPPLTDQPTAPMAEAVWSTDYEIFYNATVETDRDLDGLGDETQDPDRGGVPPVVTPPAPGPPAPAPGPSAPVGGSCPTQGIVASGGDGAVVQRSGRRYVACLAGTRTTLGTSSRRVKLRLFRLFGQRLALVRVTDGRSAIEVYDLAAGRRTFRTTRTHNGGAATRWTVTDLVVGQNGAAAWIATVRGNSASTTVWVRKGARVQNIDQGRIRPTSLVLSDASGTGIFYRGADGARRNSSFG